MPRVFIEQGTDEWLDLREGKFTASIAPALFGLSEYKPNGVRDLWLMFKGQKDFPVEKRVVEWGNRFEPLGRAHFNHQQGFKTEPAVFVEGDYLASLDGWDEDKKVVAEFKCPFQGKNSKTWKYVDETGECPPWYFYQLVQQHALTGSSQAFFMVYDADSGDDITLSYSGNELQAVWEDTVKPEWERFRGLLEDGSPPGQITDPEAVELAGRVSEIMAFRKKAEAEEKELKKKLIALTNGEEAWIGDLHIVWVESKRLDKKAAEAEGLDLSKYEKTSKYAKVL